MAWGAAFALCTLRPCIWVCAEQRKMVATRNLMSLFSTIKSTKTGNISPGPHPLPIPDSHSITKPPNLDDVFSCSCLPEAGWQLGFLVEYVWLSMHGSFLRILCNCGWRMLKTWRRVSPDQFTRTKSPQVHAEFQTAFLAHELFSSRTLSSLSSSASSWVKNHFKMSRTERSPGNKIRQENLLNFGRI